MMRYCKFCNKDVPSDDKSHWVPNGTLKPACKAQRADYRSKNRIKIRVRQNELYTSKKRITPTKDQKILLIKDFLSKLDISLLSERYVNNKSKLDLKCKICNHEWQAKWNNLKSSLSSCPICAKERRAQTNLARYGVSNPTQNNQIRLKAAKKANKIIEIEHWKTKTKISCQGSYEVKIVNYFNKFCIDFEAQNSTFLLSNGSTYTPDFYIKDSGMFVEAKGYFYPDAQDKYNLFCQEYQLPIEIWGKIKIQELENLCR